MKKAIMAKKLGMTRYFLEDGTVVPVTVLQAGPCYVTQVKSQENDGYEAVQMGFLSVREKLVNKPKKGHLDKAGLTMENNMRKVRVLREYKLAEAGGYELGQEITCEVFEKGDLVDISGVTKGKGFQGVVKRHGQARGRMSHGSHFHRAPGSMGGASDPSKVAKLKKLPGHMGHTKITVQNLTVVDVDAEKNVILIKGSVPGPNGTVLSIVDAVKNQ
ncbi:50S ribosomal protein L3 [Eubacteriales bacterium OttesenSCG-928-M02]|nr:50S ribosomal protein L3 [Eubacteriales bacterium OttesenSCG-928-M02]